MQTIEIANAVKILKNGGVIIHPTETCYGLAADIFNETAVKKIYEIKKMPFSKPVSILVSSIEEAKKYGEWNELAEKYAKKYWPGPLTLVLKRTEHVPDFLNPGISTIAMRIPNHDFSRELVRLLGNPIVSTSANITSDPSPYHPDQIHGKIDADLFIDGGNLDETVLPSTIIDLSEGKAKILRQGTISL